MNFHLKWCWGNLMISAGRCWALLGGTVSQYVTHPPALVARLGPGVGAVLDDVPDLVAVVTGVLLLGAVPGDVSGAVTFVTTVLLLTTLACEMPESVALVTLLAAASCASSSESSVAASVTSAPSSVSLRALSSEVAYSVTPVADRATTLLSRVRALASKVTTPVTAVAHTFLPSSSSSTKPSTACSSSESLTVTSDLVTTVGTLAGEVSGLLTLVTNHFPDVSKDGLGQYCEFSCRSESSNY